MRYAFLLTGGCLMGCDEPPVTVPPHPCESEAVSFDVAQPREAFGSLQDGGALWYGTPPQGGAPFTPLRLRIRGPASLADGMRISMMTHDMVTDEELSFTELDTRMTCANVGDSAGYWVGSEVHMRYAGWSLDDLEGRQAAFTVQVTSLDEEVTVEDGWEVELVR